jgi:UDPglucose--hexose-1-phosphate uridylyltransferase
VLEQARRHHSRTGRLLGADILSAELAATSRVVINGQHWSAYVPFAARWPVEVHLAPHRDVPDLPALHDDERDELAQIYLDLLRRLDRYYVRKDGTPVHLPYIAGWHQAPAKHGRDVSRLHLQVMSVLRSPTKLKYLAGSESGVGGWVNDVPPEHVAQRLREVAP